MWIKQRNHRSETLLTRWTEPVSVLAELVDAPLGVAAQSALVKRAWRYLLENHPHDSICGCSIEQVHREMAVRFEWVDQIGEEITGRSLQAIAEIIDSSNGPSVVVIFVLNEVVIRMTLVSSRRKRTDTATLQTKRIYPARRCAPGAGTMRRRDG